MPKVRVTFSKGQVKVDAQGFSGDTCRDATKLVEDALGKPTTDIEKDDFQAESPETEMEVY